MYDEEEYSNDYVCAGCGKDCGENGMKTVFWPMSEKMVVLCPRCDKKYKYFINHLDVYLPLVEEVDDGK